MVTVSVWQRKHSLSSSEYMITCDNELLYRCTVRYLTEALKFTLADADGNDLLSMKFSLKSKSVQNHQRDIRTLMDEQLSVGKIFIEKAPSEPPYFVLSLKDLTLTADAIGFGRDGLRIPVFDEEKQTALIEHPLCTDEQINEYTITALDDSALPLLSIFTVYYDRYYLNKPKNNNKRFSPVYCWTFSKRTRELYDPEWYLHTEEEPVEEEALPVEEAPAEEVTEEASVEEVTEEEPLEEDVADAEAPTEAATAYSFVEPIEEEEE